MSDKPKDERLKPCPFCGNNAMLRRARYAEDGEESWVECGMCGASTDRADGPYGNDFAAIEAWNRRTPEVEEGWEKRVHEWYEGYARGLDTAGVSTASHFECWCDDLRNGGDPVNALLDTYAYVGAQNPEVRKEIVALLRAALTNRED